MKKNTYRCENRPSLHFQVIEEEINKNAKCSFCNITEKECNPTFIESEEYDPSDDFHFPIEENRIVKFNVTKHGNMYTVYEIRECYYSKDYDECLGASPAPYKTCEAKSLFKIKEIAKKHGYSEVIARNIQVLTDINWDEI